MVSLRGSFDPKLRSRTDIASYYNGAAKLRNVIVIPQGAAKRRPGLEYVAKAASGSIKLIPFIFSDTEHYLFVLTANLVTIYKNGQEMDTVAPTISDAQVAECTWAQSYDTLLIFHQALAPISIVRSSDTSWTAGTWSLTNTPSKNFGAASTTTLGITDGAAANLDFSAWTTGNTEADCIFTAGAATFAAGSVGDYIRAGGGYAKITAYTSTTVVVGTILTPFTNDTVDATTHYASGEWGVEEDCWSASRGYPACGTFFQGRLWMASTTGQPNTLWGSIVNNENDFQNWLPSYDDNGIAVTAGGGLMSNFHNLHAGQHLYILADTGEYYIPSQNQEPITPTNISIVRNSSSGSMKLPPFEIDGAVVFLKNGGKSLLESKFTFADGAYTNKDLSLLSSHLLNNPKSIAYRKQTSTDEADYVLVVNSDGTLSVLCTLRIQEVVAWTQCETDGRFVATAVDKDEMYFIVDRMVGGAPVRNIEKFNEDLLVDNGVINPQVTLTSDATTLTYDNINLTYYSSLNAQLSYDGRDITYDDEYLKYEHGGYTSVFNASNLDGESVVIVTDNTIMTSATVAGGSVTLSDTAFDVQIGMEFPVVDTDSDSQVYIETLPIEIDNEMGSSIGQKKRVIEATVVLHETSHVEVSKNKVPIRRIGIDKLDQPVPKRSENLTIKGLLGWDDEVFLSVGQTLPLPMQLLGLAYKVRI